MSELVERLRSQVTSDHIRGCQGREYGCSCGYDIATEGLLELAAAEITVLRSGNEHMCGEIEALRQRLADTEQALQPFKRAADAFDDLNPRDHMKLDAGGLTVGDLRQARSALQHSLAAPRARANHMKGEA